MKRLKPILFYGYGLTVRDTQLGPLVDLPNMLAGSSRLLDPWKQGERDCCSLSDGRRALTGVSFILYVQWLSCTPPIIWCKAADRYFHNSDQPQSLILQVPASGMTTVGPVSPLDLHNLRQASLKFFFGNGSLL